MLFGKCNIVTKINCRNGRKDLLFILLIPYLHTCKAKSKTKMTLDRKRRSESLTPEEFRAFKKYLNTFPTKFDAALTIGISRPTLNLVIIRGSGHPDTIRTIREKLTASVSA
jgi:hypothetical protein